MYNPKLSLITFVLLLFFIIIDITNSLPEITYQETEPDLSALQGDSFTDGSLILRFVKQSQLDNCYEPTLLLRLVKPDGTVEKLDLNDIPQDNFCRVVSLTTPFQRKNNDNNGGEIDDSNNGISNSRRDNNNNGNNGSSNNEGNGTPSGGEVPGNADLADVQRGTPGEVTPGEPASVPVIPPTNVLLDNIAIYALSKKYILLTYYCNLPTSNELCSRIVDFNGVTKNITTFDNFNGSCTNNKITKSPYDDGGFLYTCYKQDTASIKWITYSAPSIIDGTITENYSGEIGNITRYDLTNIFPTEDRGYSIVTGYIQVILQPQLAVTANFITNDGQFKGSYMIYSQPIVEVNALKILSIPRCNIAYQYYGYSCVLYIETNERTFINVDFTSKGAILNSQMFSVSQLNNINNQLYDVRNLYMGGEVFVITTPDNNIYGFAYSNDGIYNRTWALPDEYTYTRKIYGINHDNTVWAIADTSNNVVDTNQWTIVYSDALTTYSTVQGNTGYGSSSILSTMPERNATITLDLNQITIEYVMSDIEPSTGYITISQKNPDEEGDDFIRIKIPAKSSLIGTANSVMIYDSVVIVILEDYIFDRGNATYIIEIDDDFVEVNGQNLIGGSWEVSTVPGSVKNDPDDARASILLTPDGTRKYLGNKNNRKTYVNDLSNEISNALAVEKGRIFIPCDRYQYKRGAQEVQILLRVDIKNTKTPNQPSTTALRNSLDNAILSKGTSALPIGPRTEDLDSTYGAPKNPNLWRKYKFILIVIVIGSSLLLLLSFLLRKKFHGGRNFLIIVFFPFILVDVVLDTLVLAVHGRDLTWFFICSLVFFLVPILFNIMILWLLINYQLNSSKVIKNWLKNHPNLALVFTLLSYIYLETLKVIISKCVSYNELNAKISKKGRKRILMTIIIITFIEDVPRLIIYALYQRYTVITTILPILALSSSFVILLFKIILFIYLMFVHKPHNVLENALEKIDDSSNDPNNLERGEGDVSNSEATIIGRQDGGVTELGNIGESSGTYIDDSDNKIAATKKEITEGELLSGNISGNKSQANKRTTEEQITEEETIKEREEIIATTTTTNYTEKKRGEF